MKLDIQGYEYNALKGGRNTLKENEPVLLIESPPEEEIVEFLKQFGYAMYAFRDSCFVRGEAGSHNTFFMTPAKSALVKDHIRADG
jgi:hypothetical protein